MIKYSNKIFISFLPLVIVFLFSACQKKDDSPSLFTAPYFGNSSTPTIDSIIVESGMVAPNQGLAGIAVIKISGKNYSLNNVDNIAYFNSTIGQVLSSYKDSIIVKVPYVVSDSVIVKTSTKGAIVFSNTKILELKVPFRIDNVLGSKQQAISMTVGSGLIYTSLVTNIQNPASGGLLRINADSTLTEIIKGSSSPVTYWQDIKVGPGNDIYLAGPGLPFVVKVADGSWTLSTLTSLPDSDGVVSLNALDFDQSKQFIWTGGEVTGNRFYSISTPFETGTINSFPFNGIIKAMKVYNNYLYIAGKKADRKSRVYRFQIISGSQVTEDSSPYFDFDQNYPGQEINSIAFSNDGFMYLGTSAPPGLVMVYPNSSGYEAFYSDIKNILIPTNTYNNQVSFSGLAFDDTPNSTYLYVIRSRYTAAATTEVKILKINTLKIGRP